MSKQPKHAPIPAELQRQQARLMQIEAVQMLLFTMDVLGERSTTFQLELDGVLESVIVKRCTQLELDEFIKSELARQSDAARVAGRADGAPLT